MAWFGPTLFGLPIVLGGIIGWLLGGLPHKDKRAIEAPHAMIQINATNLRGQDIQKLQGLQVDINSADTAVVSSGHFRVKGNVKMHPFSDSSKGLISGALSFQIPGLDTETDGTFFIVNETAADKKTKEDLEKVYAFLQEQHSQPTDPREAIARIEQALESIVPQLWQSNAA